MSFINLDDSNSNGPTFVTEKLFEKYRAHEYSDGSYKIFKEIDEDPCYEIDPLTGCNCPAATWRNNSCKHEKMVGFSRAPVAEMLPPTSIPEPEVDLEQLKKDLF